jgi:hypothetical protein
MRLKIPAGMFGAYLFDCDGTCGGLDAAGEQCTLTVESGILREIETKGAPV